MFYPTIAQFCFLISLWPLQNLLCFTRAWKVKVLPSFFILRHCSVPLPYDSWVSSVLHWGIVVLSTTSLINNFISLQMLVKRIWEWKFQSPSGLLYFFITFFTPHFSQVSIVELNCQTSVGYNESVEMNKKSLCFI